MKGLIAVLGVLITVGVVVVCAVVELLIKLAPLLVLAAWIWIAIKVWRVATNDARTADTSRRRGSGSTQPKGQCSAHARTRSRTLGGSDPGCARACEG